MINNFLTYIKESNDEFQIGDKVILRGVVDDRHVNGSGTIDGIDLSYVVTNMLNGEIVENYRYNGKVYYILEIEWWVSRHNMIKKNLRKIERPEIDPYGEDDWGYEEIKENRNF